MSGLEKFQANEAWRSNFKKLLLTERKITPLSTEPVKQSQRFSLDIAEDLIVILEEKKIPKPKPNGRTENKKELQAQAMDGNNYKMMRSEDKENVVLNETTNQQTLPTGKITLGDNILPTTTRRYSVVSYCNETLLEEQELPQWQRGTDESFETLEKMCDKTASDPNSTLFKYLHSDNKQKVVESAKKRSGTNIKEPLMRGYDDEASALQRMLDELRFDEQELENESPLKGVEVTQLEDIEPPSRLWENTIVGENILQTSPVKMVGLLRPSTIIEDVEDSASDESSQMSFQSMSTKAPSEVSSAYYETAHDTTTTSCATNAGAAQRFVELDDDLRSSATSAVINEFLNNGLNALPEIKISYASEFTEEEPIESDVESFDLIDLENTFVPLTNSPPRTPQSILKETTPVVVATTENNVTTEMPTFEAEKVASESDDSVIEILSDEEKDEISFSQLKSPIEYENRSISTHSLSPKCSRSLLSDDIDGDDENKENSTRHLDKSDDKSLHFNDTIEEVEYMMKKGMQYLAAANVAQKPTEPENPKTPTVVESSPLKNKQNTFLISPKNDDRYRSPSPMLHKQVPFSTTPSIKAINGTASPRSGEKPIAKPKPINPFTKGMKPFPKLEIFKKPTTSSIPTTANMRHKDMVKLFPHIVSPVRTYINNSTNTPLMSTISGVNKDPNSLLSLQELENECRLYKPNFVGGYAASGGGGGTAAILLSASEQRSLPKKAYIASELKHIVDERTPITIPGGKQYQKHIDTARLPAVLKHGGKLKMEDIVGGTVEATKQHPKVSHSSRRGDSFADLSIMSGDVSMYTIKDAQKL